MKSAPQGRVVFILSVLLLILPGGLSAKERRGARVVVIRLDGRQVSGELIEITQDSLLLRRAIGVDESVAVADIEEVRKVKRSRALYGFLIGAGLPALAVATTDGTTEEAAGYAATIATGALAGLAVETALGIDRHFTLAGEPEHVVIRQIRKLRAYSRNGRGREEPPDLAGRDPEPASRSSAASPGIPSASPSRPPFRPRFRIGVAATFPIMGEGNRYGSGDGSFRFPGGPTPAEAGPFPVQFFQSQPKKLHSFHYGPLSLTYDFQENWSADVDLVASGRGAAGFSYGELIYTSAADNKDYHAHYQAEDRAGFVSLLAGLTYRSKTPTVYEPHVFEVGAAVGPAFGALDVSPVTTDPARPQTFRRATLSWRIHGGYEFFFRPNLSVGASLGYMFLGMEFPGSTHSADVAFLEVGSPDMAPIGRNTEVTLPGRKITWSGFFFGLRLGFRIREKRREM